MGRYLNKDGYWAPKSTPMDVVPVSWSSEEAGPNLPIYFAENTYVNHELWRDQVAQASPVDNLWEAIKFAGAAWGRMLEWSELPMAEWDAVGRGAIMQSAQAGNIIAGNVYNNPTVDRYGPFRDPIQSQNALDLYLLSAVPRQVQALENTNQVGQGAYALGYGAPGG